MDVATPLQLAGLALLVLFAGTFGLRWAILAAALVLLFAGWVLSGVPVNVRVPGRRPAPAIGEGQ